jgi:hypothetical protein
MFGSNRSLKRAALAAAVAFALSGGAVLAAESHDHGPSQAKLVLNQGKKWPTDEPLRKGMANIRAAVAADLKAVHTGKETPVQYQALAAKVNNEVAYVVQNCKLDKDADEQLHIVIAQMLEGAEIMEGKQTGMRPRNGAERIVSALNEYGRHFDHAGWKPLKH